MYRFDLNRRPPIKIKHVHSSIPYQQATYQKYDRRGQESPGGYGPLILEILKKRNIELSRHRAYIVFCHTFRFSETFVFSFLIICLILANIKNPKDVIVCDEKIKRQIRFFLFYRLLVFCYILDKKWKSVRKYVKY